MSTLQDMAARLTQSASRAEGSLAMDNLRAVAVELDRIEDMGVGYLPHRFFPTLASGDDLTLAAANFGVDRKPGVAALVTLAIAGAPGTAVGPDIRAAAGDVVFQVEGEAVLPESGALLAQARALRPGLAGNVLAHAVTEFVATYAGLYSVDNPAPATGGADVESDADLMARVDARWKTPSTGGNAGDYLRWALAVPGVIRARVENPAAGHVTVRIVAAGNEPAGEELRAATAQAIEAVRPLGAQVTVLSAQALPVAVSARIVLSAGYRLADVKADIQDVLQAYFLAQSFATSAVSYLRIADLLFVPGVDDVADYTLNGGRQSIPLSNSQFAQLGEVTALVAG